MVWYGLVWIVVDWYGLVRIGLVNGSWINFKFTAEIIKFWYEVTKKKRMCAYNPKEQRKEQIFGK